MARKKRKSDYNHIKLLAAVFFIALLIFAVLKWTQSRKVKFHRFDGFGIDLPTAFHVHGIDVSRYQKRIAWDQVKDMSIKDIRINFAFIKATEGSTLTDKYFKYNWATASKKQVVRGVYHFYTPNTDPKDQAAYFISKVKLLPGDLPPVLDVEVIGNAKPAVFKNNLKIWLKQVETFYKVRPIIYTNADFYTKYLGNAFDEYPLWVAHYYERNKPRIDREWTFWQHSDKGNVNGIKARVDFNVFNGDSVAFQNLLIP